MSLTNPSLAPIDQALLPPEAFQVHTTAKRAKARKFKS